MARRTESNEQWLQDYREATEGKPRNRETGETDMSLIMKNEGDDFEITPEGTHIATCYLVVDLGHQKTTYKGIEKVKPQVLIGWELTNELMSDGRPFAASRIYNSFFSEKANLRKDLESWRGRKFSEEELQGFDISKLCGVPCQVTITHSEGEKTYANVTTVTGLPKGVKAPQLVNDRVVYQIGDATAFQKLPEWIQKKIENAVEPVEKAESENPAPEFDDGVPF